MTSTLRLYAELNKVEEQDDGTVTVYGIASTETRDSAGEIVKADAIRGALPSYLKYPALREMHGMSAAGKTLELEVGEDNITRIVAHVVDPIAVAKVKSGTYAGFSVGGRITKRDPKDRTVITGITLSEVSLVDRPAQSEAAITMWKAAGAEPEEPTREEADNDDIAKALANMSSRIDEIIETYNERFNEIEGGRDEAVRKVADGVDPLIKMVTALRDQNTDLAKRIAHLEAQPMPPKTAGPGVAISKEADFAGPGRQRAPAPSSEDVSKMLAALPEDERSLLLMKAALAHPVSVSGFGGAR